MSTPALLNLSALSNQSAYSARQKANDNVAFKGYYSGGWKNREINPKTLAEINKAAEASGAPKEFVQTLIGASKGAFFNPTLEKDFVFSPSQIVDMVKAYTPEKQAAFELLSDEEDEVTDTERFSGAQMRDMYLALNSNSMKELKSLLNARNYAGYHKYGGNEIARILGDM